MNEARARVCIVAESYFPNLDGGAVHARSLAEALVGHGLRTRVVTRLDDATYARREVLGGVDVLRVPPTQESGVIGRYFSMITVAMALWRVRHGCDILLVSSLRILGLPAMLVGRLSGTPCILRADSCGEMSGDYAVRPAGQRALSDLIKSAWFRVRNRVLVGAPAFIAISQPIVDEFVAAGIDPTRISWIANGIDTERFAPLRDLTERRHLRASLDVPVDREIVLYSGRLTSDKGLMTLIGAWRRIHADRPTAHLVLVGSGARMSLSVEAELKSYVQDHGLGDAVTFTGAVSDVAPYARCADVFAFPSETEALGLALLEALACELPAVASRVGGIPDIMIHRSHGLLVERGDEDGFVRGILELLADPAMRSAMGAAARRRVVEHFSMPVISREYVLLLERLAAR
jgi:glycosyltransferase involved in cell wall biosynthesis